VGLLILAKTGRLTRGVRARPGPGSLVIVRNGHHPIVVNLEPVDETQQEATNLTHPGGLGRDSAQAR
jgi:hypothetical protein